MRIRTTAPFDEDFADLPATIKRRAEQQFRREDRKYKGTFSPRRCHRPPPPAAATCAQRGRLPQHAAAARPSGAQPGGARQGTAWTCRSGWSTVERQGGTGSESLEAVRRESLGGQTAWLNTSSASPTTRCVARCEIRLWCTSGRQERRPWHSRLTARLWGISNRRSMPSSIYRNSGTHTSKPSVSDSPCARRSFRLVILNVL